MSALSKLFKFLGHIWVGLFVIVFVLTFIRMFQAEPSFYHGWKRVSETLSPFNFGYYIVAFICILPSIIFYKASDYFKNKIK